MSTKIVLNHKEITKYTTMTQCNFDLLFIICQYRTFKSGSKKVFWLKPHVENDWMSGQPETDIQYISKYWV